MPAHVTKMISALAAGKFTKKYAYDIEFTSPPGGDGAPKVTLTDPQSLFMRCRSIALPGQNIETGPDSIRMGPQRPHAFNVNFGPITAVFLTDDKLSERQFFDDWHRSIYEPGTFAMHYYKSYLTNMIIRQHDIVGNNTYGVKLFEAWPKTFGQQALDTLDGSLLTLSVTFEYRFWRPLNTNELKGGGRRYKYTEHSEIPEGEDIADLETQFDSTEIPDGENTADLESHFDSTRIPEGEEIISVLDHERITRIPEGSNIQSGSFASAGIPKGSKPQESSYQGSRIPGGGYPVDPIL